MGRNNDYTTDNLLDFEYFAKHYKLIAIDLSKQTELENPHLKQQINFIGRLERNEGATMFFIIEKSQEATFEFTQNAATIVWFWPCKKMETQKVVNLLGEADNESSEFATRKWYVINDQNKTDYGEGNENCATIKFETQVIKSNLCDYSDAYILVTGNITATGGDANTRVAFKNCAPFTKFIIHINDEHVNNADNLDIIMPMYNLTEYSDNYSDTSEGWWQFKRDESPITDDGNPDNVSVGNSSSSNYKSRFMKESVADNNKRVFKNVKIAVLLKYLFNFWRSSEMPLINCKTHLELNWTENCVRSTVTDTTFKITKKMIRSNCYFLMQRQCKTGKIIRRI